MSTDEENTNETTESKPKMNGRFSSLPAIAREDSVVQNLTDKLGNVDMGGVATEAALARKNYKMLLKAFIAAVFLIFVLVLSTFGVSFAAAILAKDTQVNTSTGALMVKNGSGDSTVVKTQEALTDVVIPNIADLSFEQLRSIKKFTFAGHDDDTGGQLDVKGVSKSADGHVTLVVEGGGTVVYNSEGIFDVTGIAKTMIASVLQMDSLDIANDDNSRRALQQVDLMYSYTVPVAHEFSFGSHDRVYAPNGAGIWYKDCCIPGLNDLDKPWVCSDADDVAYPNNCRYDYTIHECEGHCHGYQVALDSSGYNPDLHGHPYDYGVLTLFTKHEVCMDDCMNAYEESYDQCGMKCFDDSECVTADTFNGVCYMQKSDASKARNYNGCVMFVKNGGGVPTACGY